MIERVTGSSMHRLRDYKIVERPPFIQTLDIKIVLIVSGMEFISAMGWTLLLGARNMQNAMRGLFASATCREKEEWLMTE